MARRLIEICTCDGCNQRTDASDIWCSRTFGRLILDVCNACADEGKYPCQYCRTVHSDENPCESVRQKIAEGESALNEWEERR